MRLVARRVGVLLTFALLLATLSASPVVAQGVPPESGVYIQKSLQFFDVSATEIPIGAVVANFAGNQSTVIRVKVSVGPSSVQQVGTWRALEVGQTFSDRPSFERAWEAHQSPGTKVGSVSALAKSVNELLLSSSSKFDSICINVPKPVGAKPGDKYAVAVEATLDSGQTMTSTATAVAQSVNAPSGWILGDTHIHSTYSDGIQLSDIRTRATSLGHSFTYVTDHIDLIRSGAGWLNYYLNVSNASVLPYVMVPGLEVTCSDANGDGKYDGDALGYGLPSDRDPVNVQNKSQGCALTVSSIQDYGGFASAGVAHPSGNPSWAYKGTGYKSVQTLGDPFTNGDSQPFWTDSIGTYPNSCRPAATAGSDLHYSWQSMGPATWLYSPGWSSATTVSAKQSAVSQALFEGKSAATEEADLAHFLLGGQYPGADIFAAAGTTAYYSVYLYAPNNGYQVQMTWDFYRGLTRINGGTTPVLSSGSSYSWANLATTAQSGRYGYYLVVRFDYLSGGTVVFSNTAYCGPSYIHQ